MRRNKRWMALLFVAILPLACGDMEGMDNERGAVPMGKADSPDGTSVTFPISNGAGYPFSPECYSVYLKTASGYEEYPGKIKEIIYGFTSKTKDEYLINNDVPWENAKGELTHEGIHYGSFHHDGGYKGAYVLDPIPPAMVPLGKNLVFKLRLDKYAGVCYRDGDTRWVEDTLTKTYFVETVPTVSILWAGGFGSYRPSSEMYWEGELFNHDNSTATGCRTNGGSASSYAERAVRVWAPGLTDKRYYGSAERQAAGSLIQVEVYTNLSGLWTGMSAHFVAQRGNDFVYAFLPYNELCAGETSPQYPDGTYQYKLRFSVDQGQTWFWRGSQSGGDGGDSLSLTFAGNCSYTNNPDDCQP